jgi:hypothetical protein
MPAAKPKTPKKAPKKTPAMKRAAVTKPKKATPKKATPKKTPAANRARAKKPVKPHGYKPDRRKVDNDKRVPFDVHLEAIWAVVEKVWEALMKEHNIPKTTPAYKHYYRPGRIMCASEPEIWSWDFEGDPEERSYNRAETIEAAATFAGSFLGQILNLDCFEGEDHVLRKCEWPPALARSTRLKEEYAKSFDATVRALNDRKWDLRPHLWHERTRIVEKTVDGIGTFVRR